MPGGSNTGNPTLDHEESADQPPSANILDETGFVRDVEKSSYHQVSQNVTLRRTRTIRFPRVDLIAMEFRRLPNYSL